ncbi:MAG: cysteine desulfurase [Candidatus Caldarchaeales archaeon]
MLLSLEWVREDFPILNRRINGKRLIYFDNAATSQKPKCVIEAIKHYYEYFNANVHRGIYDLSEEATREYEGVREKVRRFINADSSEEIVYCRNTTEALNIIAQSYAGNNLKEGDEVILTVMEHHSNLVPWQKLQEKGIKLKFVDINKDYTLKLEDYKKLLTDRTKIVSVTHVSNVLGTINPVKEIGEMCHEYGVVFVVDAAQSAPHMPIDVREIGADFIAFSAHKMCGPTGVGILYGRKELLEKTPPLLLGSDIIKEVKLTETTFQGPPWRFETGTPNIADTIAFGVAIDYLNKVGMEKIRDHEKELTRYALDRINEIDSVKVYGNDDINIRGGVISFNVFSDGRMIHAHDVAQVLNEDGIAIRSGHHCCMPLMVKLGVPATARASFYFYNTREEVDIFVESLQRLVKIFK